jgi:hypothetical protein
MAHMISSSGTRILSRSVLLFFLFLGSGGVKTVWGGPLRINLADGTFIEVPYYWEEKGQVKFEIRGGTAGIERSEVVSVQEIIASQQFDPQELLAPSREEAESSRQKVIEGALSGQPLPGSSYELLGSEETKRLLSEDGLGSRSSKATRERIVGPSFEPQGDFAELVRLKGDGVKLLVRNIVTSRTDLNAENFVLTLYDSEGNVLQKKPCELQELSVDSKILRQAGIRGYLFSVVAAFKPDPKISRYEITALHR